MLRPNKAVLTKQTSKIWDIKHSLTSNDLIILTKQTGKIWGPPPSPPAPPGSRSPSGAPGRFGTEAGGCHTGASTWGGPPPPQHWGRRGRWGWCWPALSVASRCGSYTAVGTGSSGSSPPGPWTLLFSGLLIMQNISLISIQCQL